MLSQGSPRAAHLKEEILASRRGQSKIRNTKQTSKLRRSMKQEPRLCIHISKLAYYPQFPWSATTAFPKECAVEHQLQEALCRIGVSLSNRLEKYHILHFPLIESHWHPSLGHIRSYEKFHQKNPYFAQPIAPEIQPGADSPLSGTHAAHPDSFISAPGVTSPGTPHCPRPLARSSVSH